MGIGLLSACGDGEALTTAEPAAPSASVSENSLTRRTPAADPGAPGDGPAAGGDLGPSVVAVDSPASPLEPLIGPGDLEYLGAFRVPLQNQGTDSFNWGGTALGFNPGRNSILLAGHAHHQKSGEISIPEPVIGQTVSSLPVAGVIQGLADATGGQRSSVGADARIGGHLVFNGRLIVSAWVYYDAVGAQSTSHFVRSLDLSDTRQVSAPLRLATRAVPRATAGYMGEIPPGWRTRLGGPAFTGSGGVPIATATSNGPSFVVFNPDDLGTRNPVSAHTLLNYPFPTTLPRLYGKREDEQNAHYTLATEIRGAAFPRGTRSVLFFGRHGIGPYCYGSGAECNDPVDGNKGTHAYPYRYQIWAYDALDLERVKKAELAPHQVRPYDIWTFALPFEDGTGRHSLNGVAYDPAAGRIYVAQGGKDGDNAPLIHAFRVAPPNRSGLGR